MMGGPSTQPVAPIVMAGSINRWLPTRQSSPMAEKSRTLGKNGEECFSPVNCGTRSRIRRIRPGVISTPVAWGRL